VANSAPRGGYDLSSSQRLLDIGGGPGRTLEPCWSASRVAGHAVRYAADAVEIDKEEGWGRRLVGGRDRIEHSRRRRSSIAATGHDAAIHSPASQPVRPRKGGAGFFVFCAARARRWPRARPGHRRRGWTRSTRSRWRRGDDSRHHSLLFGLGSKPTRRRGTTRWMEKTGWRFSRAQRQ